MPVVPTPNEFPEQVVDCRPSVVQEVADERSPSDGWSVKLDGEDHLALLRVEFLNQGQHDHRHPRRELEPGAVGEGLETLEGISGYDLRARWIAS